MLPKREAQRHKDAFEFYYSMPKRSLKKVGEKYGVSSVTAERWSRAFGWADRIAKRNEKAREKTEESVTDAIAKFQKQRILLADAFNAKVAELLQKKEKGGKSFRTLFETIGGAKLADELKSKALGLPDQSIEHSGGVKVVFEDVESDARNRDSGESKED